MSAGKTDWQALRASTARIIFNHDTPGAKAFDVALIVAIVASVAAVMAESMAPVRARFGPALTTAEWMFTGLFTVE
jgi:voltage-gated potassium channel